MAKNSLMAGIVETAEIIKDKSFKDLIRFKGIAAIVLKFAIPEFKEKSLTEIARLIIDKPEQPVDEMTDSEILDDEIEFLPSELGVGGEKKTYKDAVFKVKIGDSETAVNLTNLIREYTIDTEMQRETMNLGYNLISRAVYYGASLLRNTVKAGDKEYKGIHKVYTIWLCNKTLEDLSLKEELKNRYVHRYSIWRKYEEHEYVYTDEAADLLEVVMIELPKLREKDSEAARLLHKLFDDTKNIVTEIETVEHVKLAKARKGLGMVINYEERLKGDLEEAEKLIEERVTERVTKSVTASVTASVTEKAIKTLAETCRKFKQDYVSTIETVEKGYPDTDKSIIKTIVSEVYNLQEV